MVKKKEEKKSRKEDLSVVGYTLGVISIVMSLFTSYGIGGIIFGAIGLILSKKQKTELSKRAEKLNIIGLILGAVVLIISFLVTIYLIQQGASGISPNI